MNQQNQKIIFFDGVCALCNNSVKWVIKRDKERNFLYAPLQGETAQVFLSSSVDLTQLNTIILLDGEMIHTKSSAAMRIASMLPYPWKLLIILRVFPRSIRDWVYDFISKHRYAWFGKYDTCSIPTEEEKDLFLD